MELPQRHSGGLAPDWDALDAVKRRAKALSVPLHMDGARVWSCRPFYGQRSFAEIAHGFSSVYVSFYKDIGACGGAALIGDEDFIRDARLWRSRFGGVVAEHWPVVCDTLRLMDQKLEQIDHFVELAQRYAAMIARISEHPVYPKPPQTNLFHILLPVSAEIAKAKHLEAARRSGVWFTNGFWEYEGENTCAMEIRASETMAAVPPDLLEGAFFEFLGRVLSPARAFRLPPGRLE